VGPDTPTVDALRLMRRLGVPCLPVVQDERLVGIVADSDFLEIASKLLENQLATDAVLADAPPAAQIELPIEAAKAAEKPEKAPPTATVTAPTEKV